MTEQPDTLLEYHRKKLQRMIAGTGALLTAVVLLSTGFTLSQLGAPISFATAVSAAAVMFLLQSTAMITDGRARTLYNHIPGFGLSKIKHPDAGKTKVIGDD